MRRRRFEIEIWAKICFALEYSIVGSSQNLVLKQMVGTFLLDFFSGTNSAIQAVIIEPPEEGNDSSLIKHITSGLNDTSHLNQRVWWIAMRRNAGNWFQERMRDVWIHSGFVKQVVSCLSHPVESWVILHIAEIMASLARFSLVWRKNLRDEGAIGAVIDVTIRTTNRGQSIPQLPLLRLFLLLWSSPEEAQDMDLAADSILTFLRRLISSLGDFNPVLKAQLKVFIQYLKKHRSDAAFIAHQLDVPINYIYDSARTWNYVLFQDVRPSSPCSRPTFIYDDLL